MTTARARKARPSRSAVFTVTCSPRKPGDSIMTVVPQRAAAQWLRAHAAPIMTVPDTAASTPRTIALATNTWPRRGWNSSWVPTVPLAQSDPAKITPITVMATASRTVTARTMLVNRFTYDGCDQLRYQSALGSRSSQFISLGHSALPPPDTADRHCSTISWNDG